MGQALSCDATSVRNRLNEEPGFSLRERRVPEFCVRRWTVLFRHPEFQWRLWR